MFCQFQLLGFGRLGTCPHNVHIGIQFEEGGGHGVQRIPDLLIGLVAFILVFDRFKRIAGAVEILSSEGEGVQCSLVFLDGVRVAAAWVQKVRELGQILFQSSKGRPMPLTRSDPPRLMKTDLSFRS